MKSVEWQAERNRQDIATLTRRLDGLSDAVWSVAVELAETKGREDAESFLASVQAQMRGES